MHTSRAYAPAREAAVPNGPRHDQSAGSIARMKVTRAKIEQRLQSTWPNAKPDRRGELVAFLVAAYDRYQAEGLGDAHFSVELLSTSSTTFQQRLSELLLAEWLWRHGFTLSTPLNGHGPDFKASKGAHTAWIELVTPEPTGIPIQDLALPVPGAPGIVRSVPHKERALRWTAGLQAKQQQLAQHVQAGIVQPGDACVIAVNARLLDPYWIDIHGISRRPVPVELGFGMGTTAIEIDRTTAKAIGAHTTYRADIVNKNGAPVGTHVFLDPAFAQVSAILGVALHDFAAFGRPYPSAVVYNPNADTRVPTCWLPGDQHWTGKDLGDHWRLRRHHSPARSRSRCAIGHL
jgi:hypothetical protein